MELGMEIISNNIFFVENLCLKIAANQRALNEEWRRLVVLMVIHCYFEQDMAVDIIRFVTHLKNDIFNETKIAQHCKVLCCDIAIIETIALCT